MSPSPRLSVVIPTHDTRDLTLRCLETLYASGLQAAAAGPDALEVLVVDDGSRDGSAEAISESFPRALVLRQLKSQGFTQAANLGLAAARGPILLLLNSDTEVPAGACDRLLAAFSGDPTLGIAGAQLAFPDGSPQWSGGRAPSLLWLFVLASGLGPQLRLLRPYRAGKPLQATQPTRLEWVTGAALALRRQVWEAVGPLDPDYRFYAQDLDFCLRAGRAGWKIELRPEVRILHHHGASIGRTAGSFRSQNHVLLWSDLLLWARKGRGERWARWASWALASGARLRLAVRRLASPWVRRVERPAWDAESAALRNALTALPLALKPRGG